MDKPPKQGLRVATLNTHHAKVGEGWLWRVSGETSSERSRRLTRQLEVLGQLDADVIALQEVNPLPIRAFWYAERLGKRVFFAAATQGIKCLWGPPLNLNEGVALLVPPHWRAESLGSVKLSGPQWPSLVELSGEVGSLLSFQLSESRVALAVRLHVPTDRRVPSFQGSASCVIATTQLHAGHGPTAEAVAIVRDYEESGYIKPSEAEQAMSMLRKANAVRVQQSERLIKWLGSLASPGEAVMLCGDLSAACSETPLQAFFDAGYRDAWQMCHGSASGGNTWDPSRNEIAFRSQTSLRIQQRYGRGVALVMKRIDLLPRRLDYVLERPWDHLVSQGQNEGDPGRLHKEGDRFCQGGLDERPFAGSFGRVQEVRLVPGGESSKNAQAVAARFGICADYGVGSNATAEQMTAT